MVSRPSEVTRLETSALLALSTSKGVTFGSDAVARYAQALVIGTGFAAFT